MQNEDIPQNANLRTTSHSVNKRDAIKTYAFFKNITKILQVNPAEKIRESYQVISNPLEKINIII